MPIPAPSTAAPPQTLHPDELVSVIAGKNLPAFGAAIQAIRHATDEKTSSGGQIAAIVLRDPALTAHVLRAANAAFHGYSGDKRVITVTRAVIVLGMNALRTLCISSLTIEAMRNPRACMDRLHETIGRSMHAAAQARDIGIRKGMTKDAAERLFVEAMLSRVGEMAFWSFGGSLAEAMDRALNSGMRREEAERSVLGRSLNHLGGELLKAWGLDGLLQRSREVELAHDLCEEVRQGWNTPASQQAVARIAGFVSQPASILLPELKKNSHEAVTLAIALGAGSAARFIPCDKLAPEEAAAVDDEVASPYPQPDPQLQMRTLGEMSRLVASTRSLQNLLEICVEGLHRAVGLDRVGLLLLTPARTEMIVRMEVGLTEGQLRNKFRVACSPEVQGVLGPGAVLAFSPRQDRPHWLDREYTSDDCLLGSLTVDRKVIGLVYADRQPSGRPIDEATVDAFRMFLHQVDLVALTFAR
jgi:HD-like signal output (HDOD) protein